MAEHIDGLIGLAIDVRISSREFAQWPVGCIREFFSGLARVEEAVAVARAAIKRADDDREMEDIFSSATLDGSPQPPSSGSVGNG